MAHYGNNVEFQRRAKLIILLKRQQIIFLFGLIGAVEEGGRGRKGGRGAGSVFSYRDVVPS